MLKQVLVIPDTHVPAHNQRAYDLMLRVAADLQDGRGPDSIYILGDYADFYSVMSHDRDASAERHLEREVAAVNTKLDELDTNWPKANKVFIEGNHCLNKEHRALTRSGWRTVDELTVGMEVATQGSDGNLAWEPIQDIVRRPLGTELLYQYQGRCLSMAVTEQHRVYGRSNGKAWVQTAQDCPNFFDVPVALTSGQCDYALSDDEIRIAAWGCTDVHYTAQTDSVVFYQSEGKHVQITELLDRLGYSYRLARREREVKAIVGRTLIKPPQVGMEIHLNVVGGRKVRALTGLSKKGQLPAWVSELSDRQWSVFLSTLIEADGTIVSKWAARVFYGSRELCEAVQAAAVIHGWRASLTEYRPTHWRVNLSPRLHQRVSGWRQAATKADPAQEVWCLRVNTENFITEHRGTVCLTGNCWRLDRYINKKAPELFGLVECEKLFRMNTRPNWTWIPYTPDQLVQVEGSHLYARHEPLSGGNLPAYNTVVKAGCSVIYGHDHKSQSAQVVMANGDTHLGISVGWLGDAKHPAFNYVKSHHQWMLGFGVVTIDTATGIFFVETVRIINYKCMANGVWYDG